MNVGGHRPPGDGPRRSTISRVRHSLRVALHTVRTPVGPAKSNFPRRVSEDPRGSLGSGRFPRTFGRVGAARTRFISRSVRGRRRDKNQINAASTRPTRFTRLFFRSPLRPPPHVYARSVVNSRSCFTR